MKPGDQRRARHHERGFALLLVLWTMVLLALMGTRIASSARTETALAGNNRDAAVTRAAADGGVQEAGFHLLDAAPGAWRPDGTPHQMRVGTVALDVRVRSEEGKVNPNLAPTELLTALLHQAGGDAAKSAAVASAIAAWRFPGAPRDPATVAAYRTAGLPYLPSGQPFRTLDELGAVAGMTPDLLNRVRPFLSLHVEADPDPAQASPVVLLALRDATGRAPEPMAPSPAPTLVAVTVAAAGPNGTRFTRTAVLRLLRTGQDAPAVRVLEWGDGGPG